MLLLSDELKLSFQHARPWLDTLCYAKKYSRAGGLRGVLRNVQCFLMLRLS